MFQFPDFDDHEQVTCFADPDSQLHFIVAIHNTSRGPAVGGCRMWPYRSPDQAITDALRLSKGMTYKAAIAELPCGGGKSVVIGDSRTAKTADLLHAIGRAVETMGGRYTISDDVGIGVEDLEVIRETTRFVSGSLLSDGAMPPATAYGTFQGVRAMAAHVFGTADVSKRTVAVQGLGAVGLRLARYLAEGGAALLVSDLREEPVAVAVRELGARAVPPAEILFAPVDILAPCALGAVFDDESIPRLRCRAVAGAANNQLQAPRHGAALASRGIAYAPDYVVNVGGLIDLVHAQRGQYAIAAVLADCERIFATTLDVLERAARSGLPTSEVADRLAESRFRRGSADFAACATSSGS